MRRLVFAAVFPLFLIPAMAVAQNAFDGTWKMDLCQPPTSTKPDVYVLLNGMYECKACNPPFKVKADGTDQPITGNPYIETVAIKVVNDRTIEETDKKGGRIVGNGTTTASEDGKTVTFVFSDSSNTNGGPAVTGKGQETRVADGPAGSHAVSGSWKLAKIDEISENGIVWTFKVTGDEIAMSSRTGQSYKAKLDGTDAPMSGDPGITSVSMKMIGKDTLEETDKHDGKIVVVSRMTVSADGKTAKLVFEDKQQGRTSEANAVKQ